MWAAAKPMSTPAAGSTHKVRAASRCVGRSPAHAHPRGPEPRASGPPVAERGWQQGLEEGGGEPHPGLEGRARVRMCGGVRESGAGPRTPLCPHCGLTLWKLSHWKHECPTVTDPSPPPTPSPHTLPSLQDRTQAAERKLHMVHSSNVGLPGPGASPKVGCPCFWLCLALLGQAGGLPVCWAPASVAPPSPWHTGIVFHLRPACHATCTNRQAGTLSRKPPTCPKQPRPHPLHRNPLPQLRPHPPHHNPLRTPHPPCPSSRASAFQALPAGLQAQ